MQEVEHDEVNSRWLLKLEGVIASSLTYRDNGTSIAMVSTFTNPRYRGRGLAADVVEAAVADAEARERRVVASCWYVAQWFEKHPAYGYLLES